MFAAASVALGVLIGSASLSPWEVIAALLGGGDQTTRSLVIGIRLPRVILAFLTGAALGLGGTVMQSVLENPLASPFGLGVSAGAGLGVTAAMAVGAFGSLLMPVAGFAGGILAVFLALSLARAMDVRTSSATVVLAGMVLSLFFSAMMDLASAMMPEYAQRIALWQMGSFASKGWRGPAVLSVLLALCFAIFQGKATLLDVLSFGDEQAAGMGVDAPGEKRRLIILVAALTGAAVSFAGIIGFVDLVAPHIARRLFGASHRRALPAAALLGGSFLVLSDLAARTLAAPREIPVGALTALLGAPFFLYVYVRGRGRE